MAQSTMLIGSRMKRKEDPRMITGHGIYSDDIQLPGMVYLAFLRSPYAHAKIMKIDAEEARKAPGVIAVYTGNDIKSKINPVPTAWSLTNSNMKTTKYHTLAVEKVRYVGDPIAVVVAESLYQARDAVELIEADYDVLPAVVDTEEAVKSGSPLLYDEVPNNTVFDWKVQGGDVKKAFKEAEVIVKQRLVSQRLQPTPMESRVAVAEYNEGTKQITLWVTSQNAHIHRFIVSGMLGIPENKLRVITLDVGGGFGSKITVYGVDALVAFLAKEIGRPVKYFEDRRENYLTTTHGRDQIQYVELAAKKDGTIMGLRTRNYADLGAWLSTAAPGVPTYLCGMMMSGCYKIPAIEVEVIGVITNKSAVDAYRGAGRPEASFLVERIVDTLAHELKIDPAELRLKNFIRKQEFPYKSATGLTYDSGDYETALRKAMEIIQYQDLRQKQANLRAEGKFIGIGIASYVEMAGLAPSNQIRPTGFGLGLWDSALVRVHPTGKVTVFTGTDPHGQGEETSFAQLAAEELGVSFDDVDVVHGDTEMIPFGMGTYGSRTTPIGGGAIVLACQRIREKARKIAAHLLGVEKDEIAFVDGEFRVRRNPQKAKSMAEVAIACYQAGSSELPQGEEPGLESTVFYDPENYTFSFGSHICVVEVDRESGQVKINRYVAVDDCGRQINPMLVEGQMHGGITQGLGGALWEEAVYDHDGNLLTASLADYAVPTAVEIPHFETQPTVTPSPHNPGGFKGAGETGTIGAPQALVNAVVDSIAHLGIRNIDMPLRPDKVWKILKEKSVTE